MRRTRRGPETPDDRQQGRGRKKAIGKRDAATRGGAQLRRVGPHVISMGTGLFADVSTPDGRVDHSESRFGPEKSLCANISRMSGSVIAFLKRRRGENHRAEPWINGLRPIGSSGFGFALEEQNFGLDRSSRCRQNLTNENIDSPEARAYPL